MLDRSNRYVHLGVGMCACRGQSKSIISADIQFTVIVSGEALAAKNHN